MTSRLGAIVLLVVAMLAAPAAQQVGQVTGFAVDRNGGIVPGVQVTATLEADQAVSRTTVTDADGRFRFTDLPVGQYRIEYSLAGFASEAIPGVVVGAAARVDLRLPLQILGLGGAQAPPVEPVDAGLAIVPVFFATDRERAASEPLVYGSRRNPGGALHLGRFDVSIPRDHRMGRVERPTIWTFWREDPARHLIITSRRQQSYAEFYTDLRRVVGGSTRKEAFVFVHGFNVGFEDAVFRTAQMAYDLGFDGAPILYSWPSAGSLNPIGYATDSASSDWTVPHLRSFLEDVAARSGAERVHLIAHSMGNRALVNALDRMPRSNTRTFSQILLTAPDMDADTFVQLADAVRRNGERATLYASANDVALLASKALQTYRRAGDTSGGVVVVPGIDTVDVSSVDTNLVGHFYYGDNTSVVSDMFLVLTQGLPPAERPRLRPAGEAPDQFWRFVP
jgi:esterase/lipase superfamily enzyme